MCVVLAMIVFEVEVACSDAEPACLYRITVQPLTSANLLISTGATRTRCNYHTPLHTYPGFSAASLSAWNRLEVLSNPWTATAAATAATAAAGSPLAASTAATTFAAGDRAPDARAAADGGVVFSAATAGE